MRVPPPIAFITEVAELSRLVDQQLDEESAAIARVELLDVLAQAKEFHLEPALAHTLLNAARTFFRPEIRAGVFGHSEFRSAERLEADEAVVEVQRIASEVSRLRMETSRNHP